MQILKTLSNITLSALLTLSSGCTAAAYRQPVIEQNSAGYYSPAKTIEQITIDEQHQEYYDKIQGKYTPKKYIADEPPPFYGYELDWDKFIYRLEKNSDKRAREMMYEDLTLNTMQYFYAIQTPQDWKYIVRGGNPGKFGDDLEADFLKRTEDDAKTPFTRGFTDTLKEFELYQNIAQTLSDWTLGLFEARYTGKSKLIPQIPVIDEFHDKIQNPQKYEPENPEEKEWWAEKLREIKFGFDFTGDVTKISSDNIGKAIPRVYMRASNFLRLRWDIEVAELQGTVGFNTKDFAIGINAVTNYETFEPKNTSLNVGYLFNKQTILRASFKYDLSENVLGEPHRDFDDRREIGIELFWRF